MKFQDTWFSFMIANMPQKPNTMFVLDTKWMFFNIFWKRIPNEFTLLTICFKSYLDCCHLGHNDMKQIQLIMNTSRSEINFDQFVRGDLSVEVTLIMWSYHLATNYSYFLHPDAIKWLWLNVNSSFYDPSSLL